MVAGVVSFKFRAKKGSEPKCSQLIRRYELLRLSTPFLPRPFSWASRPPPPSSKPTKKTAILCTRLPVCIDDQPAPTRRARSVAQSRMGDQSVSFLRRLFGGKPNGNGQPDDGPKLELPFKHVVVPGNQAVSVYRRMRNKKSVTPVIMGGPDDIVLLMENLELSGDSSEQILDKSAGITLPDWFDKRAAQVEEHYEAPDGEWPTNGAPNQKLSVHLDVLSKKPKEQVVIGEIPFAESWKVPAYLKLGGWNECPLPEEHVAILKRWHEQYGAEIACVTGDIIECTVARPPANQQEAMTLAREQYVYCPDIVDQGVETIENLGATLLNANVWYFWWD